MGSTGCAASIRIDMSLVSSLFLLFDTEILDKNRTNLESGFIALGSPALLAYSLTLTLFSQQDIRKEAKEIIKELGFLADEARSIHDGFMAAIYILLETHQSPMRTSINPGKLANLIVLPGNSHWWLAAKESLKHTRRGVTASLVAQSWYHYMIRLYNDSNLFYSALGFRDVSVHRNRKLHRRSRR